MKFVTTMYYFLVASLALTATVSGASNEKRGRGNKKRGDRRARELSKGTKGAKCLELLPSNAAKGAEKCPGYSTCNCIAGPTPSSNDPSLSPSGIASSSPSGTPSSIAPSSSPTSTPSKKEGSPSPSGTPSKEPSSSPSGTPSKEPSSSPSGAPSGGFYECLSGGVTERCGSCKQECKDDSTRSRALFDEKDPDFRCGCFDLDTDAQIDCVPFSFPDDCVTGCDNGNVITGRMRNACLCHFMDDHKCTPEKCLEEQLATAEEGDDPSDCRCFCQSYFADYGGPHANCVNFGTAPMPDRCPSEGIRNYGRIY